MGFLDWIERQINKTEQRQSLYRELRKLMHPYVKELEDRLPLRTVIPMAQPEFWQQVELPASELLRIMEPYTSNPVFRNAATGMESIADYVEFVDRSFGVSSRWWPTTAHKVQNIAVAPLEDLIDSTYPLRTGAYYYLVGNYTSSVVTFGSLIGAITYLTTNFSTLGMFDWVGFALMGVVTFTVPLMSVFSMLYQTSQEARAVDLAIEYVQANTGVIPSRLLPQARKSQSFAYQTPSSKP